MREQEREKNYFTNGWLTLIGLAPAASVIEWVGDAGWKSKPRWLPHRPARSSAWPH